MSYLLSLMHEGMNMLDRGLCSLGKSLTEGNESDTGMFEPAPDLLNAHWDGLSPDGWNYLPGKTANAVCVGASSVGKSTHIAHGTLFKKRHSFVVLDPACELYRAFGFYLLQAGYKVEVINWSNPNVSSGYNSLSRAKNASDIHAQVTHLVMATLGSGSGDIFWVSQSINVISFFAEVLFYHDHKYFTWVNVLHCIELFCGQSERVFRMVAEINQPHLNQRFKSLITMDAKLKTNVLSSALSCLSVWQDPNIRRISSYDHMNFSDMRRERTVVFIQSDVLQSNRYSLLNSLLVKDIITSLMSSTPGIDEIYRVYFLLDEFASMYINDLDIIISNVRKYNISLFLLIQSISQVYSKYGEHVAKIILSNCMARMFFHSQSDIATLRNMQDELEKHEWNNGTVNKQTISLGELRTLEKDQGILFYSNYPPIKLKLRPSYEQPLMYRQMFKPLEERKTVLPIEIPLIGME